MPSHITLKDVGKPGHDVKLQLDDDCRLWVDQARVHGIEREDDEVVLSMKGIPDSVRVDANAYLDFVGLHPVRTE